MATRNAANKRGRYLALIEEFPLRRIRTDQELDQASAILDRLVTRERLAQDELDYLEVLTDLVERYEDEAYPMPRSTNADLIHYLMETRGMTQAQLATATGIPQSTISAVLSQKRALSKRNILALSEYFHVDQGVFNFD